MVESVMLTTDHGAVKEVEGPRPLGMAETAEDLITGTETAEISMGIGA
jgi:hypothetical protein